MSKGVKRRPAPRGTTLVEGLVSTLLLLTALVGVLQGIVVSSRQNSMATRMTRAGAIARQTLSGLQVFGQARFVALSSSLTYAPALTTGASSLTDGIEGIQNAGGTLSAEAFDVDAYELSVAPDAQIVPGYSNEDFESFERVVVRLIDSADSSIDYIAVVVSWTEGGARRYAKVFGALYDPNVNETFVEL